MENQKENKLLKAVDVADAIIYALSAPQHVNVSKLKNFKNVFFLKYILIRFF